MVEIEISIPNLEETFYYEIELFVRQSNTSYIDSIIHWCQIKNIEIEFVAPIIKKNMALQAKIQSEGESLHFLKRIARLPI